MGTTSEQFFAIGQFAQLTGVTIRTLRYYDEKGLLVPSAHRESGYRLYSLRDIVRLEQIVALKFIGLSLKEIQTVFEQEDVQWAQMLAVQKQLVAERREQLDQVARAIEQAERSLQRDGECTLQDVLHIIKAIQMEKTTTWAEQFYSEEQRKNIADAAVSEEYLVDSQKRWAELMMDVRNHLQSDPASPEVRELAQRWRSLINEFTQGDAGIKQGLDTMYANIDSAPAEMKAWYEQHKDVFSFMKKVLSASS